MVRGSLSRRSRPVVGFRHANHVPFRLAFFDRQDELRLLPTDTRVFRAALDLQFVIIQQLAVLVIQKHALSLALDPARMADSKAPFCRPANQQARTSRPHCILAIVRLGSG